MITLDGIPGAGKSTILHELSDYLNNYRTENNNTNNINIVCLQEPVDEWVKMKNANGQTLFELYYTNQKRYALAFQLQVLHTRFDLFEKTIRENPDALIITERDIVSDYKIFTQMLYDNGMFEEIEFKLYQQLFESYNSRVKHMCDIQHRIYLATPVDVCFERMQKRGRKEEQNVMLDYLKKVEEYHEKMEEKGVVFNGDKESLFEWIKSIM